MRPIAPIIVALAMILPAPAPAAPLKPGEVSRFLASKGFTVLKLTKLPTGHEIVDVEINGQAGTFVLDSGAGATVVRHDRLGKFGLGAASGEAQGAGAGGSIAITSHPIESIALGGRAVPLKRVYSTNLDSVVARLKTATGTEIDGVVGQDILSGFSGIINIGSSELYLKLPAD
ncbi:MULTISPECIES: aspartyl protease family protein [unclassified Sphingomonas]|uniref:aspartyl protease family protein n=1 Tax=unclassified Sphingomonas TaxID=196159 RepID=UPI0009EA7937|nr:MULTISPECIES: aspartyl protease family protein [unclassified Sphingomonas]